MVTLLMILSDPTPDFKVTLQFGGEYLVNMTSHSFSAIYKLSYDFLNLAVKMALRCIDFLQVKISWLFFMAHRVV